ncbi:MAG TPA: hypothetical protein DHW82_12235 [Spirochaetia bacterium]|nr:MAG: hypothetical protein A2Y41_02915 [Spirochaetes bacterium GWB1_36_13]HCL57759.1 hypothetical protein [Spirochaetia bacterium]
MNKIRIAVLFGGRSTEYEGSVESALHILSYINLEKYEVHAVHINEKGEFTSPSSIITKIEKWLDHPDIHVFPKDEAVPEGFVDKIKNFALCPENSDREKICFFDNLLKKNYDLIFPVFHGRNGEDGSIQGLIETFNIPYIGCGILGSAIGIDKGMTKRVAIANGLNAGTFTRIYRWEWTENKSLVLDRAEKELGYPIFVKPAELGSSIGISKAKDRKTLSAGIVEAFLYDNKVILEKEIKGKEYSVGIIGHKDPRASVPAEFQFDRSKNDFFDYEAKFGPDGMEDTIPAPLDPEITRNLQDFSIKVFRALNLSGMARIDAFIDENGDFVLNEVNTIPGFGGHSVFNRLWEEENISPSDLIDLLSDAAFERFQEKEKLTCHHLSPLK